ncbi:MAG: hypothetical protein ACP5Q1_00310 [Anaerolineae bacterium]
MRRIVLFLTLCLLLTSCSCGTLPATPTPTTSANPQLTVVATSVPTNQPLPSPQPNVTLHPDGARIELDLWVDDPTPPLNSFVTVRGSILRNGVRLGGLVMRATYPTKESFSSCDVLIIYGAGVCTLPVKDYAPGVFVPITVTFEYDGVRYTGQTGFTPRQP